LQVNLFKIFFIIRWGKKCFYIWLLHMKKQKYKNSKVNLSPKCFLHFFSYVCVIFYFIILLFSSWYRISVRFFYWFKKIFNSFFFILIQILWLLEICWANLAQQALKVLTISGVYTWRYFFTKLLHRKNCFLENIFKKSILLYMGFGCFYKKNTISEGRFSVNVWGGNRCFEKSWQRKKKFGTQVSTLFFFGQPFAWFPS